MADTHFCADVFHRMGDEDPEYLVIEYESGDGVQIKFPGGTGTDHPGETVRETLHREVRTETGLVLPVEPIEIWSKSMPDRESGGGGVHTKYAFISDFDLCAGTLRTEPMQDGTDKLSPPFWRTAKELLVAVDAGGLFWSHRPMLHAAERYLRNH